MKPTFVIDEEIRSVWSLAVKMRQVLKAELGDEGELQANRFGSWLNRNHQHASDDDVKAELAKYLTIEEKEGPMAKTRAPLQVPTLDLPAMEIQAAKHSDMAATTINFVRNLACGTDDEYIKVVGYIAELMEKAKEIDAERRSFVDPLNDVVKRINAKYKPALGVFDEIEAVLKDKIVDCGRDREMRRDALLEAGDVDGAQEIQDPPKVEGIAQRSTWTGEVVDPSKIPAKYLTVDVKELQAVTKAAGKDPEIPGWQAFEKRSIAVTVSKIKP